MRRCVTSALFALLLVGAAVAVGGWLNGHGSPVQASAPPLYALWQPHVGPGTIPAVLLAVSVIVWGPRLACRLQWRWLLAAGYAGSVAWTFALAMVDGWREGIATRLTVDAEYLWEVPGIGSIGEMLRGFTGRILDFQPDSWNTHVSGHPPGVLLLFVTLDRIGLGGGGPAGVLCILVFGLTAVAVPVTLRELGSVEDARAAVPFLVLFPGAVWAGVSADGLFAGVTASGLALLAVCLVRRSVPAGLASGVLLGYSVYLSYGLVLIGILAVAVVLLARSYRRLVWPLLGASAVVAAFTLAGFWWLDGYHLVVERYYQGIASDRPYAYWVWANLAAFVLSAGPLVVLLRFRWPRPASVLPLAALGAVLVADISGLSKAEVERIWLPFAVWIPAGAALLPAGSRRWWLGVQAGIALVVVHLLHTVW
jgi:hypothetical protein